MPDEKKPPRPSPPYRDYGGFGRKTPAGGYPVPPVTIESGKPSRHDPTPPPKAGTVSNEDLAVQIKDTRKEHEAFATTTTQRLSNVEQNLTNVQNKVNAVDLKIDSQSTKIDKVTTLMLEQAQQKQTFTMDVMRMHGEVEKHAEIAKTDVAKKQEIAAIEEKTSAVKTRRERNLEIVKIAGRILGYLATGGVLVHLIEKC